MSDTAIHSDSTEKKEQLEMMVISFLVVIHNFDEDIMYKMTHTVYIVCIKEGF